MSTFNKARLVLAVGVIIVSGLFMQCDSGGGGGGGNGDPEPIPIPPLTTPQNFTVVATACDHEYGDTHYQFRSLRDENRHSKRDPLKNLWVEWFRR